MVATVPAPPAERRSPVPFVTAADARVAHPRIHRDPAWIRVRPGVYAPRQPYVDLPPWKQYAVRAHAFALAHPEAILAGPSAGVVRGYPVLGRPTAIHVFDPARSSSRRFGDVVVHTSVDPRAVERVGGILVTDAVDTVLDSVRTLSPAAGVALLDAAGRAEGGHLLEALADRAASQVAARGRARIRLALDLADIRSESVAESVSRVCIAWLGFEAPLLQVAFPHERGNDFVDFCWPSVRAIGECDGYAKYLADASVTAAESVMAEKRREERLRRACRSFDRWGWADLMALRPLEARLTAMRIPRPSRPNPALLSTIRPESF